MFLMTKIVPDLLDENYDYDSDSDSDDEFIERKQPNLKEILLLDTGSTDHLFCNARLLKNVREVKDGIGFASNGGSLHTNTKGCLPNLGDTWVNKMHSQI